MARSTSLSFTIYVVGILGALQTWGRAATDGTLICLFQALRGRYVLPGTEDLLRQRFTGIYWPIDFLLDVLVIFFWEVADGSHPAASAVGIYFIGQLFAILVAFYLEYARAAQGHSFFKPAAWLMLFQMTGIGCTGVVWAAFYLTPSSAPISISTKHTLQRASFVPRSIAKVILPSIAIGYGLPALLMGLHSPGLVSTNFKQLAIAVWNIYPLLILTISGLLHSGLSKLSSYSYPEYKSDHYDATLHSRDLVALRWIYLPSLVISVWIHISVFGLSISTTLFPVIFQLEYLQEFKPSVLFIPPIFYNKTKTVGDGIQGFMMWDQVFGYLIVAIVMLSQLQVAFKATGMSFCWQKGCIYTAAASLIVGPGSTCLLICWLRDEVLLRF